MWRKRGGHDDDDDDEALSVTMLHICKYLHLNFGRAV